MSRGGLGAAGKVLVFVVAAALVGVGVAVISSWWRQPPVVSEGCTADVADLHAGLSFEKAENAALIADVSVRRGMPSRAATIALATAYQESGLVNLDDGHLDSIGLFQQRPSMGWGTPEQLRDPYYSTNRFYEGLAKVDGYEQMEITDAAQKVQISAAGKAYAQHEPAARALASALTGQSPAAFTCEVREAPTSSAPAKQIAATLTKTIGERAVDTGENTLRITPANAESDGWAIAHWAVAHAKKFGIAEVSHAGRTWSAESSTEGWQRPGSGSADRSGPVTLTLPS